MRTIALTLLLFQTTYIHAQTLEGAWRLKSEDGKAIVDREFVKIYRNCYFAFGGKYLADHAFIKAGGGEFELSGNRYTEILDFCSEDPEMVGKSLEYTIIDMTDDMLKISMGMDGRHHTQTWERISGDRDDLSRNWVITGRITPNGEIREITPGDRRTIKILAGGRFQWVAFNSATGDFSGTGGGTYTAKDGKYTEHIEFFSRDDSRVGAELQFDYELKDGHWHHSGLSSTGNPIYEIWSPYKEAYK